MFDYLQQFNKLPKDLRDKVSSPSVMIILADLEKKYQVDLAVVVMKVMIKSVPVKDLPFYFVSDLGLNKTTAEGLAKELTENIFVNVADYLGLTKEVKALDLDTDINLIIKEASLVLPSSELVRRFKSILSTYLKGIRSKLAARDALAKPSNIGGLNLSASEIDRVFKVCEQKTFRSLEVNLAAISKIIPPITPQSRLDKIISSSDGTMGSEYNLKQAIALGQIKKPSAPISKLDTSHEVSAPKVELEISAPKKELGLSAPKPEIINSAVAQTITPVVSPIKKSEPTSVPAPAPVSHIRPFAPVHNISHPTVPVSLVTPVTPVPPVIPIIPVNQLIQKSQMSQPIPVSPVIPINSRPTPAPAPRSVAASRPTISNAISKPSMQDIKPMPKIMGPLEELQFLDLLNFRRLGKTPLEMTAKVFSKIKLLEAEGYDKMVLGVRAWRQSPVNHLYLKMMQEAILKGMTIKDFALIVQKDSKSYLNLEEIEAILSMNSRLIF